MKNVQVTKSVKNPETPGVFYRLLCLTGDNKGTSYFLKGDRVILGRAKEVDIPVPDILSSRMHAELKKLGEDYVLTDIGSRNGIFINDERVVQKHLAGGDHLIIGKTVYKYDVIKVEDTLANILGVQKKPEVEEPTPDTTAKKPLNKKLLIGVGIVALLLLLPEEEKKVAPKEVTEKGAAPRDESLENEFKGFASTEDEAAIKESKEKLSSAIQRGLRELRENNYFRAIQEFNMALIIEPNHPMASYYLSKTKQSLDEEIALNFLRGRREADSLKYQAAIVSNCAIITLLEGYESDDRYKEAKDNIEQFEEKIGLEKGETKCSEK